MAVTLDRQIKPWTVAPLPRRPTECWFDPVRALMMLGRWLGGVWTRSDLNTAELYCEPAQRVMYEAFANGASKSVASGPAVQQRSKTDRVVTGALGLAADD